MSAAVSEGRTFGGDRLHRTPDGVVAIPTGPFILGDVRARCGARLSYCVFAEMPRCKKCWPQAAGLVR